MKALLVTTIVVLPFLKFIKTLSSDWTMGFKAQYKMLKISVFRMVQYIRIEHNCILQKRLRSSNRDSKIPLCLNFQQRDFKIAQIWSPVLKWKTVWIYTRANRCWRKIPIKLGTCLLRSIRTFFKINRSLAWRHSRIRGKISWKPPWSNNFLRSSKLTTKSPNTCKTTWIWYKHKNTEIWHTIILNSHLTKKVKIKRNIKWTPVPPNKTCLLIWAPCLTMKMRPTTSSNKISPIIKRGSLPPAPALCHNSSKMSKSP